MKVGLESQLAVLPEQDKKILVADESLLNAGSALQLSHPPAPYGVYNIKLMKSGGITGAKEIAVIAKNAGIQLFWGCNDESIISITAALHAAYSCSNTRYLDLDGSFDLTKDLVEGGFILKDGYMMTNGLPGLGVRKG
jgi:L-alanine-DL-glutamate epimerase-like enolase superfamily enzyme